MWFQWPEVTFPKGTWTTNGQDVQLSPRLNKVGMTASTSEIQWSVKNHPEGIKIYTTRPDTLFGASFIALSPDHELVKELAESNPAIIKFRSDCAKIGTTEEAIATAPKLGFDTGLKVKHPRPRFCPKI